MTIGDKVALSQSAAFGSDAHGQVPLLGTVIDEPGGDAVVLWKNGKKSSALPTALLIKIFSASDVDPNNVESTIGKFVQLNTWPSVAGETADSAPKSPAAAGVVVQAYGIALFGGGAATGAVVVFSVNDGRAHMALITSADPFVELTLSDNPGRRGVRANH